MAQQTTLSPTATPGRVYSFIAKGAATVSIPGLEFTVPENRMHSTALENRMHFTALENRMHFTAHDQD